MMIEFLELNWKAFLTESSRTVTRFIIHELRKKHTCSNSRGNQFLKLLQKRWNKKVISIYQLLS